MAKKVERFEDLEVWQKSRELVRAIYVVTKSTEFQRERWLQEQIRKAAVSVMSNIAEGFGRHTKGEFARFLNMARGSLAELQSHLYVALDIGAIGVNSFHELYEKCDHLARMLRQLVSYLKGTRMLNHR
ncbi:MAG: four helix bundle protein [Armatimonadetes bacterium]|nr:four helix bundle protein [Armatimonadota bacterium]